MADTIKFYLGLAVALLLIGWTASGYIELEKARGQLAAANASAYEWRRDADMCQSSIDTAKAESDEAKAKSAAAQAERKPVKEKTDAVMDSINSRAPLPSRCMDAVHQAGKDLEALK